MLYAIAKGKAGFSLSGGFGSQRLRRALAGRLLAGRGGIVTEVVLTFFFVLIIHGATHPRAPGTCAGAIGFTLTLGSA